MLILLVGTVSADYFLDEITEHNSLENSWMQKIKYNSHSMEPTMNGGDTAILKEVGGALILGAIYVITPPEEYNTGIDIAHRFVGCVDLDCEKLIFKGDNNLLADQYVVTRDMIKAKVIGVIYRR